MGLSYLWSHDPRLPPSSLFLGILLKANSKWTATETGMFAGTPKPGKDIIYAEGRTISTYYYGEIFHVRTNIEYYYYVY